VGTPTRRELGASIEIARRRRGMTQAQLAAAAGLSRNTVLMLERGRANPSWDAVRQLCAVLGLNLEITDVVHGVHAAGTLTATGHGVQTTGYMDEFDEDPIDAVLAELVDRRDYPTDLAEEGAAAEHAPRDVR
jgi:DNA-binding XRE family transcriptional regulator